MTDRPTGLLTPKQREFLRTPDEHDDTDRQSRYQYRKNINHRIVGAILDFHDINSFYDDEQRERIFTDPGDYGATEWEFRAGLEGLLEWLYLAHQESGIDFSLMLQNAITNAEKRGRTQTTSVDVQFNVTVSTPTIDNEKVRRALEEGLPITAQEYYALANQPPVDVEPEEVTSVPFIPEDGSERPEEEAELVETILRVQLGLHQIDVEPINILEDFDQTLIHHSQIKELRRREVWRHGEEDAPDADEEPEEHPENDDDAADDD